MSGVEQRGENKPSISFKGLEVPKGVAITGLAALGLIFTAEEVYRRKRKKRKAEKPQNAQHRQPK